MAKEHVKSVRKPRKQDKMELSLQNILDLGGNKADYEILQDVENDEAEVQDDEEDMDAEPIKKQVIRDFIKELGFDQVMEEVEEEESDTEKKKVKSKKESKSQQKLKPEEIAPTEEKSKKKKEKKAKNKFKVQDEEISSTTPPGEREKLSLEHQARKYLLIKPEGHWYDHQFPTDPVSFSLPPQDVVEKLEQFAAKLLEDEVALYRKEQERRKRSDYGWIKTVLSSGTLVDKTAALTVMFQSSPVHNLSSMDTLIGMMKKKGKREALTALDTLKELFLTDVLPENRKMKAFDKHPLSALDELASGNRDSRDRRLMMWYYEAQLKETYAKFIRELQTLSRDNLAETRRKTLGTVFELLSSKPEQEEALLSMLVNKLGDPDLKVATKGAHLLKRLVEKHPNMKVVIVQEVERLLYRPNIKSKAQYYAMCFLNQLILSVEEQELAAKLITLYFSFFKMFVKNGQVESKMLGALLTGVNRAYPYAKMDQSKMEAQMSTLYQVVHVVNFNTSLQALMLLYQVTGSNDSTSDRYYMALYRKLFDPALKNSSKQAMFLNLLYKSMKNDVSDSRVKAFIKRLLQVCCSHPPPFTCGALVLLSEVLKEKPHLLNLKKMSEDSDDEEEHFEDVKLDDDDKKEGEDDDATSHEERHVQEVKQVVAAKGGATVPSWIHRVNLGGKQQEYNATNRNPIYARADAECLWELKKLACHYHPSVAFFAKTLLRGEKISYTTGDPLQDFTLIKFLDRFVYKNPKKQESLPETATTFQAKSKNYQPQGVRSMAVTSDEYVVTDEKNIPEDEKFLHRFFKQEFSKKKEKSRDDDSDADSVDDDEFDEFLDNYEKNLDLDKEVNLDFAGEFGKAKKKDKKKTESDDEESSDGDMDLDDDLSDEEEDFDDDEELREAFASDDDEEGEDVDFDEENVAFSSDDDFEGPSGNTQRKPGKREAGSRHSAGPPTKKSRKGRSGAGDAGLFAAAEEFSYLMDDNAGSQFDMISSEALSTKDKADVKQLKWETKRDQWMQDKDWKSIKRNKRFSNKESGKKGPKKFKKNKK